MMDNITVGNLTHCEESFDSSDNKVASALRTLVGFISCICCLFVISLIVLFKKYKFFTQRLILYLAVAAMIHSLSYCIARVNYYTPRSIEDPYCYFAGLFNYYTGVVELLSVWCVVISVFVRAWWSNRSIAKLEPLYLCVMFLLPALWSWIPLWRKAFGTSGSICGFKFLNSDCSKYEEGKWLLFGLWYIPLYLSMFLILILMLLVAVKVVRDFRKWDGIHDPIAKENRKKMRREVWPLIAYPFIFLLLNTFSFISQIYRAANPEKSSDVLRYLHVLTSPSRGAFIALAYALDKETRRRLNYSEIKGALMEWSRRDTNVAKEYAGSVYHGITDSYPV